MNKPKQTIVTLLRGLNVGKHHRIKMAELVTLLEPLNLQNIQTVNQSGNILFQTQNTDLNRLSTDITKTIQNVKGFESKAHLFLEPNFQKIIQHSPFKIPLKDVPYYHIVFFNTHLKALYKDVIKSEISPTEKIHITKTALYLYAPEGIRHSKLIQTINKLTKQSTTTRNWQTIINIQSSLETLKKT